jgi:hypothetical protein
MKKYIEISPVPQTGHNCKITAIATIDNYFAKLVGFTPIPLHKQKRHPISIRQIAKTKGSLQGELLEIRLFTEILKDLGYHSELMDVQDNVLNFQHQLQLQIDSENLIIGCFAVDRETEQPASSYENNEHAAVIHGYDLQTGMLDMTHWGKNRKAPIHEFYHSSLLLPQQRESEHYVNIKSEHPCKKYELCSAKTWNSKQSLIPTYQSGFRGKLIIIKPPKQEEMVLIRKKLMTFKHPSSSLYYHLILSLGIGISSTLILWHFLPSLYLALISTLYLAAINTFWSIAIFSLTISVTVMLFFLVINKLLSTLSECSTQTPSFNCSNK